MTGESPVWIKKTVENPVLSVPGSHSLVERSPYFKQPSPRRLPLVPFVASGWSCSLQHKAGRDYYSKELVNVVHITTKTTTCSRKGS